MGAGEEDDKARRKLNWGGDGGGSLPQLWVGGFYKAVEEEKSQALILPGPENACGSGDLTCKQLGAPEGYSITDGFEWLETRGAQGHYQSPEAQGNGA